MSISIHFETERAGSAFRGLIIDLTTFERLARTVQTYASADAAKSAAVSMWRVMQTEKRVTP